MHLSMECKQKELRRWAIHGDNLDRIAGESFWDDSSESERARVLKSNDVALDFLISSMAQLVYSYRYETTQQERLEMNRDAPGFDSFIDDVERDLFNLFEADADGYFKSIVTYPAAVRRLQKQLPRLQAMTEKLGC